MVGNERWADVVGFKGHYQVSRSGNVWSLKRRKALKPRMLRGYLAVYLRDGERISNQPIHRIVASAFLGPSLGRQVRHLDGNRLNNEVENLAWGTAKDNAIDRDRHGTTARGERQWRAKLTKEDVTRIRNLGAAGYGSAAIGRIEGMPRARVHEIITRKTWKHIP